MTLAIFVGLIFIANPWPVDMSTHLGFVMMGFYCVFFDLAYLGRK